MRRKLPKPPFPYHHRASCRDLEDHDREACEFGPWTKVRLTREALTQARHKEQIERLNRSGIFEVQATVAPGQTGEIYDVRFG